MYGNTIVDGFMTYDQAQRDKYGLLTPQERGRCAANAMSAEIEGAENTIRAKAEAAAIKKGGRIEERG